MRKLISCVSRKEYYRNQIRHGKQHIDENPQDKFSYAAIAVAYWHIRNFTEAKKNAEIALKLDPDMPEPYWILAYISLDNKEPIEIYLPMAERAYELAQENVEAVVCFGLAKVESGNLIDGLLLLESAVELNPLNIWARSNLAIVYGRIGDVEKFKNEIIQIAKIRPTFFTIARRYWLFLDYSKFGRFLVKLFLIMSYLGTIIAIVSGFHGWLLFAFIFWLHYIVMAILRIWSGQKKTGVVNLIIGISYVIVILLLFLWLLKR